MKTKAERIQEEVEKITLTQANGILAMLQDGHKYSEITIAFDLPREDMIPAIKKHFNFTTEIQYWTEERIHQLRQLHASGIPYAAIVEHFPNASIGKIKRQLSALGLKKIPQDLWDERIDQIREMLLDDRTYPYIANKYGISVDQLKYQLRKRNINKKSLGV